MQRLWHAEPNRRVTHPTPDPRRAGNSNLRTGRHRNTLTCADIHTDRSPHAYPYADRDAHPHGNTWPYAGW